MSIIRNIPRRLLELSTAINIALLIWFLFYRGDRPDGAPPDGVWEKESGVREAYSKKLEYRYAEKEQWQGVQEQKAESDLVDRAVVGSGCEMCAMDPVLCQELGRRNLERSLLFSGTGTRFQRMLSKLKRGEQLVAGVLGGPGARHKQLTILRLRPIHHLNRIVFDRLNYLFPAPNGVVNDKSGREEGKNSYTNGAQGGVGSDYFSLCYGEHIPEDVDVVFVDLAINDEALVKNIDSYKILVRSLLDLPNKPAILNLHVFALMFKTVTNGGDLHSGIAQFYDIPTVSLRNALYHQLLANASLISELFITKEDGELGVKGHNLLGRIGAAYVDSQVCEMEKYEASFHQPVGRANLERARRCSGNG
ncbi:hypothetical protein L202_06267 [Cryptococcus amylolentus CBS 6039]|uniref:Uncharacterized protein n=1 Tax=Cryptococcus amylolentus CBS 6039 TaxID=1295533 RepID=A0A1E3HFE2_9TREE|nr:hypothetical protein L202_06267 [Cryptococcus amylolentus CBS 6039]ODN75047.1 hypothetical protein L202_06267 [Cryptococcus amylolentus CBS 6039]